MDPLEAIKVTFFQECEEQLSELEAGLLAMEQGETDSETVNAVFRAVHSIKGGAGAFSLEPLVRFAHVFETTLDDVRAARHRFAFDPTAMHTMPLTQSSTVAVVYSSSVRSLPVLSRSANYCCSAMR